MLAFGVSRCRRKQRFAGIIFATDPCGNRTQRLADFSAGDRGRGTSEIRRRIRRCLRCCGSRCRQRGLTRTRFSSTWRMLDSSGGLRGRRCRRTRPDHRCRRRSRCRSLNWSRCGRCRLSLRRRVMRGAGSVTGWTVSLLRSVPFVFGQRDSSGQPEQRSDEPSFGHV